VPGLGQPNLPLRCSQSKMTAERHAKSIRIASLNGEHLWMVLLLALKAPAVDVFDVETPLAADLKCR
jgi:hypothetical protein